MDKELRILKSGGGWMISLKQEDMDGIGFEIGDTLVYTKIDGGIVITKKTGNNFEERWNEFFENGGSYNDKVSYDWGEPRGREKW